MENILNLCFCAVEKQKSLQNGQYQWGMYKKKDIWVSLICVCEDNPKDTSMCHP